MENKDFREPESMASNPPTNQIRSHTASSNKRQRKKKSRKSKRKGCYDDLAVAIGPELAALPAARSIEHYKARRAESTEPVVNGVYSGVEDTFHSPNCAAGQATEHNQPMAEHLNSFPTARRLKDPVSSGVTDDPHLMDNVEQGRNHSIVTHPTDELEQNETPMELSVARSYSGVTSAVPVTEDSQLKRPYQTSQPKTCYFDLAEVISPQLAAMDVRTPGDSETNGESSHQHRATKSSTFS